MRRYLVVVVLLMCCASAHALESLRVGNQLLVVGDSAARVKALMGNPSVRAKGGSGKSSSGKRSSKSSGKGKKATAQKQDAKDKGEKWQYRRDGHTTIFTIVGGKIAHIEDLPR
ncbi:DUF2845 domain-containing protein [Dyella mobilis]|uniref:DUF2845 domain-containing protein n=1 Tax=Dyella mobilis TaxID=1849582 RepID=A0ABS2KMP5_9GAMM|nr:DUF2845 domain-containing protein [Dyella mobilis]MBM7132421.1 DUF2845 domain-containing protein [Dyella mobilis]GLQ95591.1 hypothetical protein GCM10007863_00090 [Dyella mobilis]